MKTTIREFQSTDYEAFTEIHNAVYSEYSRTVDEICFEDKTRDPKCFFKRFVLERDNKIIAAAFYGQFTWMYHPKKFLFDLYVPPAFQGQGLGRALYDHLYQAVHAHDPIRIITRTREDWNRAVRFLADRQFEETSRAWESRLDVKAFDFSPYQGVWDRLKSEHGIVIKTFQELENDPERNRKGYDLDWAAIQDMPMTEPITRPSFEQYCQERFGNPNFLPDAHFFALHGDDYVGISDIMSSQANDEIITGFTGVLPAYRGKGIAFALKLRAVDYAIKQNKPLIKTWNDSANRSMLGINERLGFVKQPAWIEFKKDLREARSGE